MRRTDPGASVICFFLSAVPEEVVLFTKVAKFVVCRNELVSYDSLLLVNEATDISLPCGN